MSVKRRPGAISLQDMQQLMKRFSVERIPTEVPKDASMWKYPRWNVPFSMDEVAVDSVFDVVDAHAEHDDLFLFDDLVASLFKQYQRDPGYIFLRRNDLKRLVVHRSEQIIVQQGRPCLKSPNTGEPIVLGIARIPGLQFVYTLRQQVEDGAAEQAEATA